MKNVVSELENKYNEFWKDIVENSDGTLNKDQIMKELSDYSMMIGSLSELYCYISGNRCSKPDVTAKAVLRLFEEQLETRYNDGYSDAKEDFQGGE